MKLGVTMPVEDGLSAKDFVRIAVELDFDQREETIETYDPNQTVLRSEQRSEEQSAEAGTKENSVANYEVNTAVQPLPGIDHARPIEVPEHLRPFKQVST